MTGKYIGFLLILGMVCLSGCHRQETGGQQQGFGTVAPAPVATSESNAPDADAEAEVAVSEEDDATQQKPNTVIDGSLPVITALTFKDPIIRGGQPIELVPEWTAPQGEEVTFNCQWFVNGEEVPEASTLVLAANHVKKKSRIRARVTPVAGSVEGPPFFGQEFVVPNSPPLFVSEPELQFRAEEYLYEAKAEDPDGDVLTYALDSAPPGMTIESGNGKVRWNIGNRQAGEFRVRISARDNDGMSATQEYVLTVTIE